MPLGERRHIFGGPGHLLGPRLRSHLRHLRQARLGGNCDDVGIIEGRIAIPSEKSIRRLNGTALHSGRREQRRRLGRYEASHLALYGILKLSRREPLPGRSARNVSAGLTARKVHGIF